MNTLRFIDKYGISVALCHDFHNLFIFSKHISLSILKSKSDILKFHSQKNISAPDMSRKLIIFANFTQNTFLNTGQFEIIIPNFDQKVFFRK
jgi:hypothetical protein